MKNIIYLIILITSLQCTSETKIGKIDPQKPYLKISFSSNSESYPWLMGTKYPQMAV